MAWQTTWQAFTIRGDAGKNFTLPEDVIGAVGHANEIGCRTLGLCGFGGGRLMECVQRSISIQVNDMQFYEDMYAIFGHIVVQSLCKPH